MKCRQSWRHIGDLTVSIVLWTEVIGISVFIINTNDMFVDIFLKYGPWLEYFIKCWIVTGIDVICWVQIPIKNDYLKINFWQRHSITTVNAVTNTFFVFCEPSFDNHCACTINSHRHFCSRRWCLNICRSQIVMPFRV